jgi:hypothetical protein
VRQTRHLDSRRTQTEPHRSIKMRGRAVVAVLRYERRGQAHPQSVGPATVSVGHYDHIAVRGAIDETIDFFGRDLWCVGRHDQHRRMTIDEGSLREAHRSIEPGRVIVQDLDALGQHEMIVGRHDHDAIDTPSTA